MIASYIKIKTRIINLLCLVTLISASHNVFADSPSPLRILVAHPVIAGLAVNLTEDTTIIVNRATPENLPATRQLSYITGRGAEGVAELAAQSDVVLSIRSIWNADQLYPIARRSNIRLIEIDVAQPVDGFMPGVTLPDNVNDGNTAQPWLDPKNLGRMADIMVDELSRMSPEQRLPLEKNLGKLKQKINLLSQQTENQLAQLDELHPIIALSPHVISFINAYALEYNSDFIDNSKLDQLIHYIKNNKTRLAISHVQPETEIKQLLSDYNVQLLVIPVRFKEDPFSHLKNTTEQLIKNLTQ